MELFLEELKVFLDNQKIHCDDIWHINLKVLMDHRNTFLDKHLALLCRLAGGTIKVKIQQLEECLVYLG